MACLPSDDILGSTGVSVLLTLTTPTTLEDVAQKTGLPLFRVRGTVRRLLEAGFTHQVGQMYEITPAGIEELEQKEKKPDIDDISLKL
jgi:DNA-binding IclR family transcriptional regulator